MAGVFSASFTNRRDSQKYIQIFPNMSIYIFQLTCPHALSYRRLVGVKAIKHPVTKILLIYRI